MRKYVVFALLIGCLGFASCGGDLLGRFMPKMEDCKLVGIVRDMDGSPIADVEVSTGRSVVKTNARGVFAFDKVKVVGERCVLGFVKEGYFSVTRANAKADEATVEVVMQKKGNAKGMSASAKLEGSQGGEIGVGKMKINIPQGAFKDKYGQTYNGEVNADMLYLNPNHKNFQEMMPGGDLVAVRSDSSETFLKSYGMVEVSFTDSDGNKLQMQEGVSATLTFPIPSGMNNNPPAEIPLWAFDEEKGLWTEEGMARLEGEAYVGEVKHFSWHNLDVPSERVTVKGIVKDEDGNPLERIKVTVGQTSAYTDKEGKYSVYIPENTDVRAYVKSADYCNYAEKQTELKGTAGGGTIEHDITLPVLKKITGKVKNTCGESPMAMLYIDYNIGNKSYTSMPVWSNASDGSFSLQFPKEAKSIMLHIDSEAGSTYPRPYFNIVGDINAGEIDVCVQTQEKEKLNVKCGESDMVFEINEQTLDVASDIGGVFGVIGELSKFFGGGKGVEFAPRFITITNNDETSVLTIWVMDFVEGKDTYDANIYFTSGNTRADGKGYFTVAKKEEDKTILTLACNLTDDSGKTPITIAGMFSMPEMENGSKIIGGIKHLPESCPKQPRPILSTYQYRIDGHWITGCVYKATDYDAYKEALQKAGAKCVEERSDTAFDGKEGKEGIFYHKDYMVRMSTNSIIVMDNPSAGESEAMGCYSFAYKKDKKMQTEEFWHSEIEAYEKKAMMQTMVEYPIRMERAAMEKEKCGCKKETPKAKKKK